MTAPTIDYAHTKRADANRDRKAIALAAEARRLGYMPFELRTIGGTPGDAERREIVRKSLGLDRAPSVETWTQALVKLETLAFEVPGIVMCPDCDWPVHQVTTEGGKRLLLDPFPRDDGSVQPLRKPDGTVLARVYAGGDPSRPLDEPIYRQHSRSCPNSPASRRVHLPRCTVCNNPLYGPLVAKDPTYTTHPNCDPGT